MYIDYKNPTLAKFFREIGYTDELGSGFIKITENSYLYAREGGER